MSAALDALVLQQQGVAHLHKLFLKGGTGLDGRPISSMWTVSAVDARQRGGTGAYEHAYELCFVCDLCGKPLRKGALKSHRKAPMGCIRGP